MIHPFICITLVAIDGILTLLRVFFFFSSQTNQRVVPQQKILLYSLRTQTSQDIRWSSAMWGTSMIFFFYDSIDERQKHRKKLHYASCWRRGGCLLFGTTTTNHNQINSKDDGIRVCHWIFQKIYGFLKLFTNLPHVAFPLQHYSAVERGDDVVVWVIFVW